MQEKRREEKRSEGKKKRPKKRRASAHYLQLSLMGKHEITLESTESLGERGGGGTSNPLTAIEVPATY